MFGLVVFSVDEDEVMLDGPGVGSAARPTTASAVVGVVELVELVELDAFAEFVGTTAELDPEALEPGS